MQTKRDSNNQPIATDAMTAGTDRNAFLFGFTPQAEIWNGRFAMIGFVAYLLWDLGGYSVVRDVLNIAGR